MCSEVADEEHVDHRHEEAEHAREHDGQSQREQLAQLRLHRRTLSNALTGMRLQVPVGGELNVTALTSMWLLLEVLVGGELNVGGVGGAQCRWTARAHSRGLDRAARSEKVQEGGRNADISRTKL